MNRSSFKSVRHALLAGCAVLAVAPSLAAAQEQVAFDIPAQTLDGALTYFGRQSGREIIASADATRNRRAPALRGQYTPEQALAALLADSGLTFRTSSSGSIVVEVAQDPQGGSAGDVDALIVTAQKREEAIQDVPIAISAFSAKALEEQKIEGGFDLLKAIPNVTFSKSNFSSYNFSIRGVGTKAISATTDPGVAVAFNNTTLIQNRLFEQEYFDVERVEVLRGPQGTLYGRNATSGVINVISAKPDLGDFEGSLKAEIGNYDTRRLVGMMNIPLIEDVLAVRVAGAMTERMGYDYNEITGNNVNGRDLWSGRVTVGFEPTPRLRANLMWEHFEEDDDRSRTSKQLCHRDPGPTKIGSTPTTPPPGEIDHPYFTLMIPAKFSQSCRAGSLYDAGAFDAPNGLALPFVFGPLSIGFGPPNTTIIGSIGTDPSIGEAVSFIRSQDPYRGLKQSHDLRTIASIRDPRYRAKADVIDLTWDFDVTDSLTFTSQTVYNEDEVFSFQDYNRFNSFPAFVDSSVLTNAGQPSVYRNLSPRPAGSPVGTPGVFCDPQIGCSDRLAGFDISQAKGKQFSQELRLSSNFDGPINFSVGANYTKFETVVDYYVFINALTALAQIWPFNYVPAGEDLDPTICQYSVDVVLSPNIPVPAGDPLALCPYIDLTSIDNLAGDGHNYFRSKNPYDLKSTAAFGEVYWEISDALKVTAGLRYTDDRKNFIPVPSQVLLAPGQAAGGNVSRGYPEDPPIKQKWGEFTGRLGVDWKPELGFTDQTMLYAFYSHGYKGGGANPPRPDFATGEETMDFLVSNNAPAYTILLMSLPGNLPVLQLAAVDYGDTFEPEFVDAFEVGAKNTLLDGAMTFNATGFYYDYKDYQVSQIRDRTAVNENFDAKIWGLEFETTFAPSRNLRLNANLGYLDTKIADGATSIDIMDRTQGNPNYIVTKPWVQLPSNCVVPVSVVEAWLNKAERTSAWQSICARQGGLAGNSLDTTVPIDPATGKRWDPLAVDANGDLLYPEINGGAGIRAQLGGNELPNAPHWTMNAGAQYGRDILDGSWRVVMRGDAYWQSQSWARVYNAVNDKLHGWYNLNASIRLENRDRGIEAEFYVKNLLDKSPITDAFINSDDSGLTTNVFVLDPRLVGFSLRKTF